MQIKPEDIDDTLQAFFSMIDDDDHVSQGILEYCHRHSNVIAQFIQNDYLKRSMMSDQKGIYLDLGVNI